MKIKDTILIVDDTPKNIQVLATILDDSGYLVKAATDGKQALETVENSLPDLILLDIMMPGMDGFEVCKELKKNEKTKDVPVIFLTAKTETTNIIEGFELGAVDYITKPFNSSELLSRVKTHVELKKAKETINNISRERKELIHVLCHDLTNPIGFVISAIDISKDNPSFWEKIKSKLETSMNNSLEMINLVRTMMAIEENKVNLTTEIFELTQLIEQSLEILELKLKQKQLSTEVNIPADLLVRVEKTSFINSVINNIVTNAIKFSETSGKILLCAKKENEKTILSIKDFGIGMSKQLIGDLFDINKPTSRTGTAGESGTGFGMPLMKKFVKAYGGEIHISSIEKSEQSTDHGTEVTLILNDK